MSFFEELKRRNVIRVAIAYGVAAWFVLQLADVVLENIGAPEWVMQTIMLFLAAGFPLVIIFAWAFEMTPEGIKKEKDVDRSQSIASVTGRKLDRMIIGVLTVTVAYLLIDKLVLQDTQPAPTETAQSVPVDIEVPVDSGPSVAVLPFINMSGDKENEYFSDGLTETLLHMLAQLPGLHVAARTSSFAFKGQNSSVEEIANTLGVAHILEGSVQKSGQRVRITAQLIRAQDGFHVWSQNYDRTLEDIFAIQDEIAEDVAAALDESLLGGTVKIAHIETSDIGAYDTYLRAMEQQSISSYGSLSNAESLFKQALAADPDFTDAKLALARNYFMQFNTGLIEEAQMQQTITPLLSQVRESQPENRLARAIEKLTRLHPEVMMDQDIFRAEVDELRALLPLIPAETYIRGQAATMIAYGLDQPEAGLEVIEAGLMVDPLSAELYAQQGNVYRKMEQYGDARDSFLKAIELDPLDPNHYGRMSGVSENLGDINGSFEWRLKNIKADPQDHEVAGAMARSFYNWGLPEEGDRWLARVRVLAPNSDILQRLQIDRAISHGDSDQVIAIAEKMIAAPAGMRHGSFPTAVFSYDTYMSRAGRYEEAYNFLVGIRPEITSFEQLPGDMQGVLMQWVSIELMSGFRSPEERKLVWQKFAQNLRANAPWWFDDPVDQSIDFLFMGDLESAIEKAREDLAQPLATWPIRDDSWDSPTWHPITSDPGIAARLSEIKREKQQARIQINEMLQGPEWQQ
ncbi:MAG: tetratricopeptide repeat protein [Xanthomonadales bacterium]|nr:tetratricopeptide repeat protein [Xanthomonadales bacterium]